MSLVSIPFQFQPGTPALSSQVDANFNALAAGFTSIDNTNVGPLGFYASQIIPVTSAGATFGGSVAYTFTQALTAPSVLSGISTPAHVPPLYTQLGADYGLNAHSVVGKIFISVPSGHNTSTALISLAGAAAFLNEPTVTVTLIGSPSVPGWTSGAGVAVNPVVPPYNLIQVNLSSLSGTNSSTGVSVGAYWQAMGA